MCPNDDVSGRRSPDPRDTTDPSFSGAPSAYAMTRPFSAFCSAGRDGTVSARSGTGAGPGAGLGTGSGFAASAGLPTGLAAPTIQLAHALQLLRQPVCPEDGAGETASGPTGGTTAGGTAARPADGSGLAGEWAESRAEDMADARRLVADALASLSASAGLSVPVSALVQNPEPEEVDSELEAAFVEFDLAREAWCALPSDAETWTTRSEVDRYLAAEDSILAIADARAAVLRRQADLLLDLAADLSDQVGPAAANAIANVAQGLLLRLSR